MKKIITLFAVLVSGMFIGGLIVGTPKFAKEKEKSKYIIEVGWEVFPETYLADTVWIDNDRYYFLTKYGKKTSLKNKTYIYNQVDRCIENIYLDPFFVDSEYGKKIIYQKDKQLFEFYYINN